MTLLNWIEKYIHPPGIRKANRRKIYSVIAGVIQKLSDDSHSAFRDHFPALCSDDRLEEHGEARRIPWFTFDTNDTYRERLAVGAYTLERTGEYGFFKEIMDQMFPDRWKYIEYPENGFTIGYSRIGETRIGGDSQIIVFIKNMTDEDHDNAYEFLDWFLGSDIQIKIVKWEYVPYDPVSFEVLQNSGGADWLEDQLEDIAETVCEIMPDNSLIAGKTLIPARVWDGDETVLIYVKNQYREQILLRLGVVLSEEVFRKVIDIQFKGE